MRRRCVQRLRFSFFSVSFRFVTNSLNTSNLSYILRASVSENDLIGPETTIAHASRKEEKVRAEVNDRDSIPDGSRRTLALGASRATVPRATEEGFEARLFRRHFVRYAPSERARSYNRLTVLSRLMDSAFRALLHSPRSFTSPDWVSPGQRLRQGR